IRSPSPMAHAPARSSANPFFVSAAAREERAIRAGEPSARRRGSDRTQRQSRAEPKEEQPTARDLENEGAQEVQREIRWGRAEREGGRA
ncbi:hypothetical protein M9458_017310, partial [Cirrhinus mrigala]